MHSRVTQGKASSRGETKYSALLSSRDTDLLEPNEWTQGCRASSSVWREDSGLLSRSGRKRSPQSRDDGGVTWVFPSSRASRHFEEGLSRSFSDGGGKPSFPSTSAGDLRELPREPLRGEGCCGVGGDARDMSLSKLWDIVKDREAYCVAGHRVTESDMTD